MSDNFFHDNPSGAMDDYEKPDWLIEKERRGDPMIDELKPIACQECGTSNLVGCKCYELKVEKPVKLELQEIISDAQIAKIFGNANYGMMARRDVVRFGLLKCVCGYRQGHTSTQILNELGLTTKKYAITKKGKKYLWFAFDTNSGM